MKEREISDAFSPVPGCVHQAVLKALKETKLVKEKRRRFAASLVIALLILLLLMGVGIATNQWGVLDYLFGGIQNADEKTLEKVWAVGQSKTALGVTATIDSLLLDGNRIAVGWLFENDKPDEPAYIVVEPPTAGGRHITIDSNDGIEYTWLPDPYEINIHSDSITKGGFTGEIQGGIPIDAFEIGIRISIFKPVRPIYVVKDADYLNKFGQVDYSLMWPVIWEKSRHGYLVVDEYGVVQLTLPEGEKTEEVFVGGLPDEIESTGKFEREDIEFVISLKNEKK